MDTAEILPPPTPKTGLSTTDVNDDPPAKANMVALGYENLPGALVVDAVIIGEGATPRALTGAWWFGWHSKLDVAVALAPVLGGEDLEVSEDKAVGEALTLVAGIYSHLGIGLATLAADTIAIHVYPVELRR